VAAGLARDDAQHSFWLETAGDDLTPRAPLRGDAEADVAILGAGFTGLWTAYYLHRRDPSLRIVLLEKEIAGFGASGRNGGWCSAGFALGPAALREKVGREAARALLCALVESVDEVGAVLRRESIDADYVKGGSLRLALGPHHVPALHELLEAYRALGLEDHYQLLDAGQVADRVRVEGAVAALRTPDAAVLHPGKLVRGLARALEAGGVTIHERTEVTGYAPGRLVTRGGELRAGTVVLAGESYLSRLRRMHRRLVPVYSLIALTEPLSDAQWEEIGWRERECVGSCRLSVDYLQRTADGRILFGGRGAPYRLGSRIRDAYDRHPPTHELLRRLARRWFPALRDTAFTHAWGGPLGVTRDWMPAVGSDPGRGLAWSYGYAGQGVSTANLAGRTLADLLTGTRSALTELPVVGHRPRDWEPEPLRWLGVRWVQSGYRRLDERAERTGVPPSGRSVAERLGRH
jgi:glycine/D-amino acid oxidase-like deaminating enzyme